MALVYATIAELAEALGEAPPPNAEDLLRSASDDITRITRTAIYPHDGTGMPTGQRIAEAFSRATCLQVRWWIETGDSTGSGSALAFDSVSILSVRLSRARTGPRPYVTPDGREYGPGVMSTLIAAGVFDPERAKDDTFPPPPVVAP